MTVVDAAFSARFVGWTPRLRSSALFLALSVIVKRLSGLFAALPYRPSKRVQMLSRVPRGRC